MKHIIAVKINLNEVDNGQDTEQEHTVSFSTVHSIQVGDSLQRAFEKAIWILSLDRITVPDTAYVVEYTVNNDGKTAVLTP